MSIRGGRHQQLGERGEPGVYLLHFDRPTPPPHDNGDAQHYVGESHDTANRVRQHRNTAAGTHRTGTPRARIAALAGIGFQVARVEVEQDRRRRRALEREWQAAPAQHCPACR